MSTTFFGVAVDCADAAALARFWGLVLGRAVDEGATSENAVLLPHDDCASGPRLAFHRVPEAKLVKNRLHLDIISDTFDVDTQRVVDLGARKLRDGRDGAAIWTTFADIEGNEFDLIAM
jgi:hypothetical protein